MTILKLLTDASLMLQRLGAANTQEGCCLLADISSAIESCTPKPKSPRHTENGVFRDFGKDSVIDPNCNCDGCRIEHERQALLRTARKPGKEQ